MMQQIANEEQHEQELQAVELTEHPTVRAAYDRVRKHWLEKVKPTAEMMECFEWAFEEVMFSAALWSSNQDVLRPRVVTITRLEHTVAGKRIPGSRWGMDNPDSIYRVIPISGDEKYLIHGRVAQNRLTENYFTLWDKSMNTVDVLSGHDLVLRDDRSFTIEVDSKPADGRVNHIQSSPLAQEFYIRDVLLDWATDQPNELNVERVGPSPGTAVLTIDEQAEMTASYMLRFADFTYFINNRRMQSEPNQIGLGWTADTGGAMRNQVYVPGRFKLGEDEALVITLNDGGADYFTVPFTNIWGTTMNIVNRTSTLNKSQSVPNSDGTYTFVVSRKDPGVHNWLDTCGLSEGMLTLRFAEFPGGQPSQDMSADSEVVKMSQLPDILPDKTAWVDSEGRRIQQRDRAAAYMRRLPEVKL